MVKAEELAGEFISSSPQFDSLSIEGVQVASVFPRTYRVDGWADGDTQVTVYVVKKNDGSLECDGMMHLGRDN